MVKLHQIEFSRESVLEWEKIRPGLKELNDATLDKSRGFVIARAECVRLAGGEKQFEKVSRWWKLSVLGVLGITIEYDPVAKGYRFIDVDKHLTKRHERLLKSAENKHREEARRLALMRDADFTSDHQRQLRVFQMQQHADTAGKLNAQVEHNKIALRQPETLPRMIGG